MIVFSGVSDLYNTDWKLIFQPGRYVGACVT